MALKSFLSLVEKKRFSETLVSFIEPPDGDEKKFLSLAPYHFSKDLEFLLLQKLQKNQHWDAAGPIALGSWARGELCPHSDLDMLFIGEEKATAAVVEEMQNQGIKVRSRMPKNSEDWTIDVESFDILTLLEAKALTTSVRGPLFLQQKKIWSQRWHLRRRLLQDILSERETRTSRYDSISNFLEPNIKYGPGALRDLEQGLQIHLLFNEKFMQSDHALHVLKYYKTFFLLLRQKLHLLPQSNDSVSALEQTELALWFGYKDLKDFMREIQKGLQRGLFYSDYILEVARSSDRALKVWRKLQIPHFQKAFEVLKKNPSRMNQYKVRVELDGALSKHRPLSHQWRLRCLKELMQLKTPDSVLVAVFQSRLIDRLLPEIKRLVGYVQHDQYHRFTAEAHLLQVLREVKRLIDRPYLLGRLKNVIGAVSEKEALLLRWVALYHDLGKGLGGDHSQKSLELLKRDFKGPLKEEMSWFVEHHLILSEAAFRRNPRAVSTWEYLKQAQINPQRLRLLCLFTVADIKGTNPEAWNDWKEKLLYDLCLSIVKPSSQKTLFFEKHKIFMPPVMAERLDPFLLEQVPLKIWKKESQHLSQMSPFEIYEVGQKQKWIRFYQKEDRPGVFLEFVSKLYSIGLDVIHAFVVTVPDWGVYDWFNVQSTQSVKRLREGLFHVKNQTTGPLVPVETVELITSDEDEWVISFKGKDQKGFLLHVTKALVAVGAEITWANLHTWGRAVDDVFGITPQKEKNQFLNQLQLHLPTADFKRSE